MSYKHVLMHVHMYPDSDKTNRWNRRQHEGHRSIVSVTVFFPAVLPLLRQSVSCRARIQCVCACVCVCVCVTTCRCGSWTAWRPSDNTYLSRQRQPVLPAFTSCARWVQCFGSRVRSFSAADHSRGQAVSRISVPDKLIGLHASATQRLANIRLYGKHTN